VIGDRNRLNHTTFKTESQKWLCSEGSIVCLIVFPAYSSDKKGACVYNDAYGQRVNILNVGWYYSWKPTPINGVHNAKFVPLIWGGSKYTEQLRSLQDLNVTETLLGFNEPDNPKQALMQVDEALKKWREIQNMTKYIGSPAVVDPYGKWFKEFYKEVKNQGLKMDFLAVHWYNAPNPQLFLNELDDLESPFG
jgi:hypothetical protein